MQIKVTLFEDFLANDDLIRKFASFVDFFKKFRNNLLILIISVFSPKSPGFGLFFGFFCQKL